jgi:hypothetical protein
LEETDMSEHETETPDLELMTLLEWLACWRELMARRHGTSPSAEESRCSLLDVESAAKSAAAIEHAAS